MLNNIRGSIASLAIISGLVLPHVVSAMEKENIEVEDIKFSEKLEIPKELTRREKDNAYKIWLIREAMEISLGENVPKEILELKIGGAFHDLTKDPVLGGELIVTDPKTHIATSFKIKDHIKDGVFDFSNKSFNNAALYYVITTDPEKFFHTEESRSAKLIILIASRDLIEEQINTSAKHFAPIMENWKKEQAPIGIFWRIEQHVNLSWYEYLITENIRNLSILNLYELLKKVTRPPLDILPYGKHIYSPSYDDSGCFTFKPKIG